MVAAVEVNVVQVNIVVADLQRSRDFYERIGLSFRDRGRSETGAAEAYVSTGPGVVVVLHSPAFALWWDPSNPGPQAGGPQIDLGLDTPEHLDAVVAVLRDRGATVAKQPMDMSFGQRFAVVLDPDGHRVGLKAPLPSTE